MDAVVGVQVGDEDARRVHPALAHEQPIQVATTERHGAALADHDPRLERVEDVEELAEGRPELVAQDRDVGPAGLILLASDDRNELPLAGPRRGRQGRDRLAQLVERLGVGGDERQVHVVRRIRRLPRPRVEPGDPLPPVDGDHAPDPSIRHHDRAGEPERSADPVEVEAQDEVGDEPWVAEAEPDRRDDDRPADEPGDHLEQALDPAIPLIARCLGHGPPSAAPGRPRDLALQ